MSDPEVPGRRNSDVLDAIWEKVADKPEHSDTANMLFRAKALAQLDVAAEVDNQLPLVSRRSWLLLVGVAVLVAALFLWASFTPSSTSIAAPGRFAAAPGAMPVVAPTGGVLVAELVAVGTVVTPDQPVATLRTADGDVAITAVGGGTVWQVLATIGEAVSAGATVITLLPPGSDTSALLAIPETQAMSVQPGMTVDLIAGGQMRGQVTAVSAPLPAADAGQRTGLALSPTENYSLVTVSMQGPLPAGSAATGQVILSDSTVFERVLGT